MPAIPVAQGGMPCSGFPQQPAVLHRGSSLRPGREQPRLGALSRQPRCSPARLQHSPRYKQGNAPTLGAADSMFLGFVLSGIITCALALSCNTPAPSRLSQSYASASVSLPEGAGWVPHPPGCHALSHCSWNFRPGSLAIRRRSQKQRDMKHRRGHSPAKPLSGQVTRTSVIPDLPASCPPESEPPGS